MPMIRCQADQHFYDSDKHQSCPYCRDIEGSVGTTARFTNVTTDDELGPTVPITSPRPTPTTTADLSNDMTVGVFKKKSGFEPVVGWLVCTEGLSRGKDYRIKPGINKVGRSNTQDIVIEGDKTISKERHACIEYDADDNAFDLIWVENPAVKLNGTKVRQPTKLIAHDVIQLGESMFIFVPLCTEKFKWVIDMEKP
jgi:hypothetical protein